MQIVYRLHAIERMFERKIKEDDANRILFDGKIIEEYVDNISEMRMNNEVLNLQNR
jgi:hypothetical protein